MDKHSFIELVTGALGGGAIVTLIGKVFDRKKIAAEALKNEAEAGDVKVQAELRIVESALSVNEDMRTELKRISERVTFLEDRIQQIQLENEHLQKSLNEAERKIANLTDENKSLKVRLTKIDHKAES